MADDWFTQNAPTQTSPAAVPSPTPDATQVQNQDWFAANAPQKGIKDQLADFGKSLWQQINPVAGLKGLAEATSHPAQTINNDVAARQQVLDKAHDELSKGNYSDGAAYWLYAHIPFLGAQIANAGEQFKQGNYGAGAGTSTGIGLNLVGPKALKDLNIKLPQPVADATMNKAQEMYQSALKPRPGSNSTAQVARMVNTGIQNQIPVSAAGLDKLSGLIDDLNVKIANQIALDPTRPINKFSVASRLGDVYNRFSNQVTPAADLRAISKTGQEFLNSQPSPIAAEDAQALKQGTYQQLSSKAYGELKSSTIESQKALARGLKEELAQAFPELSDLNAKEGSLISLQNELERSVRRIDNHQMFGIGTPAAAAGVKAMTGSNKVAAVAAIARAAIDNPGVKSRLAFALAKASDGKLSMGGAMSRVQGYVNALGQATDQANIGSVPFPQMAQQDQAR